MSEIENSYELYIVIDPMFSKQQYEEYVGNLYSSLEKNVIEIYDKAHYGIKKLAYVIAGKSTGFCLAIQFKAEPTVVKVIEGIVRRDEKILRFLITKLDNFALQYYAEKKLKSSETKLKQEAEFSNNI